MAELRRQADADGYDGVHVRPARRPGAVAEHAGAGRPSVRNLLFLQRAAGNTAAQRAVQGVRSPAVKPTPVQRIDPPAGPAAAIIHDHHQLPDDGPLLRREIQKVIGERGWGATRVWASAFYAAEPTTYLRYHPDEKHVAEVRRKLKQELTAMEGSVKQLTGTPTADLGDVVIGQGDFDRHLERNAGHLLDNSEVQLRKEASRYGLKESGWVFKDYSMTTGPEQQKLQAEAGRLAGVRSGCDVRRFTFLRLQKQADQTGREFEQAAKAIIEVSAEDAARREWIADEDAYHAACQKAQAEFPVLAAYTTGENAAEQLRAIGSESATTLAERLYKTIDERIKNVASVREQMAGHELWLWKQPQLVALTKAAGTFEPWEIRVIDEAVTRIKHDEAERQKTWTAFAIGLGLLAAIPTGGTSALATVAAAGATLSAVYSLDTLYEHYKDYTLASAAAGMSLDQAKAISADDPSMMWLAYDLLDLGLNVAGAVGAFKTLKTALAAAEAGGPASLIKVFTAADQIGLKAASKGRLAKVLLDPKGGPRAVQEMLQAIRDTIAKAGPGKDPDFINACKRAATTIMDQGRVGFIRVGDGRTLNEIERVLKAAGEVEPEVSRVARVIHNDLETGRTLGGYYRKFDIVLIKEGDEMANVLIHELAHRSQNLERQMHTIGTMRREFQAYHAEREFLLALPDELVPVGGDADKIRHATDEGLKAHIMAEYAEELSEEAFLRPNLQPLTDVDPEKQLIVDWFKKLAAWK
ncbi:hypothetical protein [Actinoplanes sp. NBRC 103695]|uniref:hypothetical protein n=1 Tax=Actinoplanes sp. NBRC 103695 TaxID=3032202 RepID=UPI0024A32954|nr:hypothetical protein [Actinoplanes sp. NBRC 103695]GLY94104.1 hypothetical protein Acsp02_13600 [Actinoplanes sp. NBRC 103695]